MLKLQVIGHLGSDATLQESNGHKYVSFRVAHSERFQRNDGTHVDRTTWVSCILNGDGGQLLQYLVKGTQVYCDGEASFNVYSSPKTKRFEAGVQLSVRNIELIGGRRDAVPSRLYTADGVMVDVYKAFFTSEVSLFGSTLRSAQGQEFAVGKGGFIDAVAALPIAGAGGSGASVSPQPNNMADDGAGVF